MSLTSEQTGLAEALVRLSHLVARVYAEVSRGYELTPQQAQLLCTLIGGPVGMTELTRQLHLEKSSLTGLVDRVEQRGLVTRSRDSRDRRACRIALTGHGADLAAKAHQQVTAQLERLTEHLPDADRKRLVSAIADMIAGHHTPQ